LRHFPNLESLDLAEHENQGDDVLDLTNMSKLRQLGMPLNHSDINFGEETRMPNLEGLSLMDANDEFGFVSFMKQIDKFTNVKRLNLTNCVIIKDEHLVKFVNLEQLNLTNNTTMTNNSLQRMTKLKRLLLSRSTNITNDGVAPLTNLEQLSLDNQENINYSLVNLKKLDALHCINTDVSDEFISYLTSMTHLKLSNNRGITGRALLTSRRLRFLGLDNDTIVSGEFVKQMTWLQIISLRENRQIVYQDLKPLVNLIRINVRNSALTSNEWDALKELFASKRRVKELEEGLAAANEEIAKMR
jgi:internalin A